ncbi:acrosin-like [Tachyglossus aculeatus]|uniref:acrosin-like n=1 Tax=Tachyglossus aculeatus TaxID=9261 RepID=UPI0018F38A58|nr:acrosin-like [Tachyglossus aculeatus]
MEAAELLENVGEVGPNAGQFPSRLLRVCKRGRLHHEGHPAPHPHPRPHPPPGRDGVHAGPEELYQCGDCAEQPQWLPPAPGPRPRPPPAESLSPHAAHPRSPKPSIIRDPRPL